MLKVVISSLLIALSLNAITIEKRAFTIEYNEKFKGATKVSYTLDKRVNEKNIKGRDSFYKEKSLDHTIATMPDDYTNTGFDRGHLASDASFDYDLNVLNDTYSMANVVPQYPDVNRRVWLATEELERYSATQFGHLRVENIVLYGNEIMKKLPLEVILPERKFKDAKHKENYIAKYNKDAKNLENKRIYVPTFFIKKMFNDEYTFEECFKIPNLKNIDTSNVDIFKVDCKTISHF